MIDYLKMLANVEPIFSDVTLLYFFSALLQGNAAMLSIVGVFFVFHIQALKSAILESKNSARRKEGVSIPAGIVDEFSKYDINTFLTKLDKLRDKQLARMKEMSDNKDKEKEMNLYYDLDKWHGLQFFLVKARAVSFPPMVLIGSFIIFCTFGLCFASWIHKVSFEAELITLIACSCFQLYLVYRVLKAISQSFDDASIV